MPILRLTCLIGLLIGSVGQNLFAQNSLLENEKRTLSAKWELISRVPSAAHIFAQKTTVAEKENFVAALNVWNASNPPPSKAAKAFAQIALAMANPSLSDQALTEALVFSQGDAAVNYELARILTEQKLFTQALIFEKETLHVLLEKGYIQAPELAKMSLLQVREGLAQKQMPLVQHALNFAEELDPLSPWIPFMRMELLMRGSVMWKWDFDGIWKYVSDIFQLSLYYESQSFIWLNFLQALRLGISLFCGLGLLTLGLRHFTQVTHLWAEKLPREVEISVRYAAIALGFCSLWAIGCGGVSLALIAVLLLWKVTNPFEKGFLKFCLLAIFLLPFSLLIESVFYRHLDPKGGLHLYDQSALRGYESEREKTLTSLAPKDKEEQFFATLAASILYRKQGNYRKAQELSDKANLLISSNAYGLNAEANLAMILSDFDKAAHTYAQATAVAPNYSELWFNASQTQLYNNNSYQHKEFLDRAAELDAPFMTLFLKNNDEHFPSLPPNRKVMDLLPRISLIGNELLETVLSFNFQQAPITSGIFVYPALFIFILASAACLYIFFRYRGYSHITHGRKTFRCKICNKTTCVVCRKGIHCQECYKALAGINDGRLRIDIMDRLKKQSILVPNLFGKILNAAFPGSGTLYMGSQKGRYLWMLINSFLIAGIYQIHHLVKTYPDYVLGPLHGLVWIPLLLLYSIFIIKLLRGSIGQLTYSSTGVPKENFI